MNGLPAFIIFIIVAVVSNLLSKAKEADEAKRTRAVPPDDPEQAARTRRIQEEIRRKIAGRRDPMAPPEEELAAPMTEAELGDAENFPRPLEPVVRPFDRPEPESWQEREAAQRESELQAELARQAGLAARFAALAEAPAKAGTMAVARVTGSNWAEAVPPASGPPAWRKDLRGAGNLRRAMVLREVLGPPAALR